MQLVSRTDIGLPSRVLSGSGSPRPRLNTPTRWVTYHYTGVNVGWGDVGDTANEIRGIESYAKNAGKPNEYNYVIDQDDNGKVWEYAGPYRAAHSAGENSDSVGVLFLNGTNEPITPVQIRKAQWLNRYLRDQGITDKGTLHRGHRDMPKAATACPGDSIYAAVPQLAKPGTGNGGGGGSKPTTPVTPDPQPLRDLRRGMYGEDVADLQRALNKAGFKCVVDGDFGPQTERTVRAFQARHELVQDGWVGPQTRAKLESLAHIVTPVGPPDTPDGVGYYLVKPGDTPWAVSAQVYGTGTRWPEIVEANKPDAVMNPGERWKVPGFTGEWYTVKQGDTVWGILDAVFDGKWDKATGVEQFMQWNGGTDVIRPGEKVWIRR